MRFKKTLLLLPIGLCVLHLPARSQTVEVSADRPTLLAATSPTVVPMLVRYDGVATRGDNSPATGKTSITFVIYKEPSGGDPLWIETQSVETDAAGRYWAYLGSTYSSGLPANLFGSGEARWLEVQIAGGPIQPRTLLTSVPYALKAADAATLGGLPASAFALAGTTTPVASSAQPNGITPDASASNVTTTGGTSLYLPKFNAVSTIINSQIYDNGTSVGIGDVPNASAKLDVNGPMIMRGNMTVSRTGNATASKAFPSYGFDFFSNAYNSSTKATVNPYFQLQSEPTGNNSASPSATFNLLFSNNGKAAAETGFYINPNGTVHFATSQTFPATSSSGTAVDGTSTSGTGVQGNSTSSSGVAGNSSSGDGVLGVTAGTTLHTAGVFGIAGTGNTSGFIGIAGVWGDASQHVGVLGTSDQFSGVQGESATGDGVSGSTSGSTMTTAGVYGAAGAGNGSGFGTGGISGVWGDSSANTGVLGSSDSSFGVQGASNSGTAVWGYSNQGNGAEFYGANNGDAGVGVMGTAAGQSQTYAMYAGNTAGAWGDASQSYGVGVFGTADGGEAGFFVNNTQSSPTLVLENNAPDDTDQIPTLLYAYGDSDRYCKIDITGELICNSTSNASSIQNGERTVKTFAVQSAESWYEDAGSGELVNGSGHVDLEPTFGQTVNTAVEYHVFLTPDGDCKGLYVAHKSASGFDVRELGGGKASVPFEYRIMAKRMGHENERLVDLTEQSKRLAALAKPKALAKAGSAPAVSRPALPRRTRLPQ